MILNNTLNIEHHIYHDTYIMSYNIISQDIIVHHIVSHHITIHYMTLNINIYIYVYNLCIHIVYMYKISMLAIIQTMYGDDWGMICGIVILTLLYLKYNI